MRSPLDCRAPEPGNHPIVYQALAKTIFEFSLSDRQLRNLENQLIDAEDLAEPSSGNHCRYRCRNKETGAIQFAYGIDLSTLTARIPDLEASLDEKDRDNAA